MIDCLFHQSHSPFRSQNTAVNRKRRKGELPWTLRKC